MCVEGLTGISVFFILFLFFFFASGILDKMVCATALLVFCVEFACNTFCGIQERQFVDVLLDS